MNSHPDPTDAVLSCVPGRTPGAHWQTIAIEARRTYPDLTDSQVLDILAALVHAGRCRHRTHPRYHAWYVRTVGLPKPSRPYPQKETLL